MIQSELPILKNIKTNILGSYGEVLQNNAKKSFLRHTIEWEEFQDSYRKKINAKLLL